MKKLAFVLASVFIAHAGFAQVTIDPEVGINFNQTRTVEGNNDATQSDSRVGLKAGAGVNIPLSESFYLKPGLFYQNLGNEVKESGVTAKTNLHYLQVPVNLGYRYQISPNAGALFAEAGPYAGYALDGDAKIKEPGKKDFKNDIHFGDGVNEVNRFDWGFNFGVGYESPWGIYVKGGYGLGLGNLSNVKDVTVNNRNWTVGVGYNIAL